MKCPVDFATVRGWSEWHFLKANIHKNLSAKYSASGHPQCARQEAEIALKHAKIANDMNNLAEWFRSEERQKIMEAV